MVDDEAVNRELLEEVLAGEGLEIVTAPDGGTTLERVPLTARVLQIVDVYDALPTQRSYKPALSPADALEIMEEEVKKGWWDPAVFQEFCKMKTGAAAAAGASGQ